MKTVYKYTLATTDEQILSLPKGSRILSVEEQNQNIVLYALVDTEEKQVCEYKIIVVGTGHIASDAADCEFLGTVKLLGGELMFHVFVKEG
jgi:hypothetical protein